MRAAVKGPAAPAKERLVEDGPRESRESIERKESESESESP